MYLIKNHIKTHRSFRLRLTRSAELFKTTSLIYNSLFLIFFDILNTILLNNLIDLIVLLNKILLIKLIGVRGAHLKMLNCMMKRTGRWEKRSSYANKWRETSVKQEDDQSERREKRDVGDARGTNWAQNTEGRVRRIHDHEERLADDARVDVQICLRLSPSGSCHAGH